MKATLLALALLTAGASQAYAQAPAVSTQAPTPRTFVTQHSGVFNGQTVNYLATVGETVSASSVMIAPETKAPTIGISENRPTTKARAKA